MVEPVAVGWRRFKLGLALKGTVNADVFMAFGGLCWFNREPRARPHLMPVTTFRQLG